MLLQSVLFSGIAGSTNSLPGALVLGTGSIFGTVVLGVEVLHANCSNWQTQSMIVVQLSYFECSSCNWELVSSAVQGVRLALSNVIESWSSTTNYTGTSHDVGIDRAAVGVAEINTGGYGAKILGGSIRAASFRSPQGTKFTATWLRYVPHTTAGGATAGQFVIGAATCTVVITMNGATGLTAANGWFCKANDETTVAGNTGLYFSAHNATTATLTVPATAAASDVITFGCMAY